MLVACLVGKTSKHMLKLNVRGHGGGGRVHGWEEGPGHPLTFQHQAGAPGAEGWGDFHLHGGGALLLPGVPQGLRGPRRPAPAGASLFLLTVG